MDKPLLLIDVDGVLNPFQSSSPPPGFNTHFIKAKSRSPQNISEEEGRTYKLFLSSRHAEWLQSLQERAELVWATTWGDFDQANRLLSPIFSLPSLPTIQLDYSCLHSFDCPPTWKLASIQAFAKDRPLIWLDDDLHQDAFAWAAQRPSPTLLILCNPIVGWVRKEYDKILRFLNAPSNGFVNRL